MDENKSGRVVVKKKVKKQALGTFIRGILRRGSFHWRARNEALVAARVERGKYRCASCGELFGPKEVDIDHIHPVIDPKVGFVDFDDYIKRLFCEADGFQILCNGGGKNNGKGGKAGGCHGIKCDIEDAMRDHYKSEKEEFHDFKKRDNIEED